MGKEIDDIVKSCYNPRLKKSKSIWYELTLYLLLVITNIKDSYLIDCCSFDSVDNVIDIVRVIVESVNRAIKISDHYSIDIIIIGGDYIIIRHDTLNTKLEYIKVNTWLSHHPLIVDISSNEPRLVNDKISMKQIGHELLDIFVDCIDQECAAAAAALRVINVCDDVAVSLVLIAGWLLGYPCIYMKQSHTSSIGAADVSDSNTNALSMLVLSKYSVKGTLNTNYWYNNSQSAISILEFSVPDTYLLIDGNKGAVDKLIDDMAIAMRNRCGVVVDSIHVTITQEQHPFLQV